MNQQPIIWERFVSRKINLMGTIWVYSTEKDLIAAMGKDNGFHRTSLQVGLVPESAIDFKLPSDAELLRKQMINPLA